VEDRQVVEVLGKFSNKLPTKGLVRVYLSMHPLVYLFFHFVYYERDNRFCLFYRSYGLVGEKELELVLNTT